MINLNDITINKRLGSLIGRCFQMPYVSYCHPLATNYKKMIRTIITLVLINAMTLAWGSQIGIGFSTKDISVWRYWEKTDSGFKHKILVLNVSDSPLNIKIQQEVFIGYHFKKDTTQTKIIGENTILECLDYIIFDIDTTLVKSNNNANETRIFQFIINGKIEGAISAEFERPPHELNSFKYVSYTGLNGGSGKFWIAKNSLFAAENQSDSITLLYRNIGKPIYKEKEQYWITIQPTNNFSTFEVSTNGIEKGYYNNYSQYEIRVSYSAEVDPATTSRIIINYNAIKKSKIYLGLVCRYGIRVSKNNGKDEIFDEEASGGIMTIPILMK